MYSDSNTTGSTLIGCDGLFHHLQTPADKNRILVELVVKKVAAFNDTGANPWDMSIFQILSFYVLLYFLRNILKKCLSFSEFETFQGIYFDKIIQ